MSLQERLLCPWCPQLSWSHLFKVFNKSFNVTSGLSDNEHPARGLTYVVPSVRNQLGPVHAAPGLQVKDFSAYLDVVLTF